MRIALAQLNPTVGDLVGNAALIRAAVAEARRHAVDLVVFSELVISGYPPKDLLLRQDFVDACDALVEQLASDLPLDIGVLVGHPTRRGLPENRIANAASLLYQGHVQATVHKLLLPNYDVFDERRYFRPAERIEPLVFKGQRLGVHICEDAWWGEPETAYHVEPNSFPDPIATLASRGVDLFINLSASPFEDGKPQRRRKLLAKHARRYSRPFVFVNQVGGNDDLVFDGHSLVLNATGEVALQAGGFREDIQIVDVGHLVNVFTEPNDPTAERARMLLDALTLGLRDYMQKSGFSDCVLGLSGGIDSALAAAIGARACEPQRVHGLLMPSRFSSQHSIDDALALAENLGIDAQVIPIDAAHRAYEGLDVLAGDLASQPQGLADQNLQARIRGAIVMTRSNRHGWLALATGNKSELAVGYCTLYGDMCGGFAVLSDLFKRDVYELSRAINIEAGRELIPISSIEKAPSAELAPNQFDQDTLPPYPILDAILEGLIEREESARQLAERFPAETVRWVISRLDRNEFKRRQMAPGIKLSERAFGTGRRMPLAARIGYEV